MMRAAPARSVGDTTDPIRSPFRGCKSKDLPGTSRPARLPSTPTISLLSIFIRRSKLRSSLFEPPNIVRICARNVAVGAILFSFSLLLLLFCFLLVLFVFFFVFFFFLSFSVCDGNMPIDPRRGNRSDIATTFTASTNSYGRVLCENRFSNLCEFAVIHCWENILV